MSDFKINPIEDFLVGKLFVPEDKKTGALILPAPKINDLIEIVAIGDELHSKKIEVGTIVVVVPSELKAFFIDNQRFFAFQYYHIVAVVDLETVK